MNPYMCMGMGNPLSMGLNPGMMMGMQPQNMAQFRNKQELMTGLQVGRSDFMDKFNPLFSMSQDTRLNTGKSLFDYQADVSEAYSPYSSGNIAATQNMMADPRMLMNPMMAMGNPFSMGYDS